MGKDSASPPAAPNYNQAAQAQQASSLVDQYTPYGSLVYSPVQSHQSSPGGQVGPSPTASPQGVGGLLVDFMRGQAGDTGGQVAPSSPMSPTDGRWQSVTSLNPQAQHALDTQLGLSSGLGDLALSQLGNVNNTYSKPFDMSSVGDIADKAYGAFTSRLDPYWSQQEEMQRTQLANQGLSPGSQAYDNAMRDFNQAKNDAYQQANLGAIQTMPQTFQLAESAYNQPLNILNAIRSGAQVQNPQFQSPGAGANYLGAAQAGSQYNQGLYNAQVGQQNAMLGGLFQLGSAALPLLL